MKNQKLSEDVFETHQGKWENHSKTLLRIEIFDVSHKSMQKIPLKQHKDGDKDVEDIVASYYRNKGYEVINAAANSEYPEILPDPVEQKLDLNKFERAFSEDKTPDKISDSINSGLGKFEKGFPDLVVYDLFDGELRECKVVEVKSQSDSLGYDQLKWFVNSNRKLNAKIAWVREGKHG